MLRNNIVKHETKVECYRDRLIFVKISAKPVDIVIVQVYMPTNHNDEDTEKMYYKISDILHQEGGGQAMREFNRNVGEGSTNKDSVKEMREARCS